MNPSCKSCGGSGWLITERNGNSGAERCGCSVSAAARDQSKRPTREDIMRAVAKIAELGVVPFFPQTIDAWMLIVGSLSNYISDQAELMGFTAAYLEHAKKWEGLAGMREIYSQYVESAMPANAGDLEHRYLLREIEANEQRMAIYKRQRLLEASAPDQALPAVKMIESAPLRSSGMSFGSSRSFNELQDALTDCSVRAPVLSLKDREEQLAHAVIVTRVRSHQERLRAVQEIREKIRIAGDVTEKARSATA